MSSVNWSTGEWVEEAGGSAPSQQGDGMMLEDVIGDQGDVTLLFFVQSNVSVVAETHSWREVIRARKWATETESGSRQSPVNAGLWLRLLLYLEIAAWNKYFVSENSFY